MDTIAITGTTGFLGARASEFFKKDYNVIDVTRAVLDITNEDAVLRYFDKLKPTYVLHSAAISIIDQAENNPELSDKTNRLAPFYIAKACKNIGAKLINMSSDQVYTGNKERFKLNEDVSLNPQNLYAKQKMAAEQMVSDVLPSAVSLRLTWMYDVPSSPLFQHDSFPKRLIRGGETGVPIKINVNELRSITYIKNVIENLPACYEISGGVYNYGSENRLDTTYNLYREAAKTLGFNQSIIEGFEGEKQNLSIDTSKLKNAGIFFPSAIDGFKEAMRK